MPFKRPDLGMVVVCPSKDLKDGTATVAKVDGVEVGIWRVDGRLFALANECAHKAASLHRGDIEDIDGVGLCIRCPKHRKKFAGMYTNPHPSRATDLAYVRCALQVASISI